MARSAAFLLLILLTLVLVVQAAGRNTSAGQMTFGDANCDGHTNSIDAAVVLQFAAGLLDDVACPDNGDVDGDGQINSLDAAFILQYAAGLLDGLGPPTTPALPTATLPGTAFGRTPIQLPGDPSTLAATLLLADTGTFPDEAAFDRMALQFGDGLPALHVQYVSAPIDCVSGGAVEMEGQAFLQIRAFPAAAHDSGGNPTVPTGLVPGLPTILEARQTCDFEGVIVWVLGLSSQVDYRVIAVANAIYVVDVRHPDETN